MTDIGNTEAPAWELFAADVVRALEKVGNRCLTLPSGTGLWSTKGVAARIALRANEHLGATLNLLSIDAITASRTLARGLLECAFASAALTTEPDVFLRMLKDDSERSRHNQGNFILERGLGDDKLQLQKLRVAISAMDRKLELISPKKVALLGPLAAQYLQYQRLSDDSAHLTARSLEHYVARETAGWRAIPCEPSAEQNLATLQLALQSSLLTAFAVCEVLEFSLERTEVGGLLERLASMPQTRMI
ncbi:hypothetical protein AB4Y45_25095 [Paraburkholderia sp. EG287A]|uniref:hypothetical protein n=1 Tax=unclassified Paraburkholderia TaxID=2615204 RepID=UPI0034D2DA0E